MAGTPGAVSSPRMTQDGLQPVEEDEAGGGDTYGVAGAKKCWSRRQQG